MAKRLLGTDEDWDGFLSLFCYMHHPAIALVSDKAFHPHKNINDGFILLTCWLRVVDIKGYGQLQCFDQCYMRRAYHKIDTIR